MYSTGLNAEQSSDCPREESLQESRLRSAPAMLHSIGQDGCLRSVSDRWLRKFGYERHEVIGTPIVDLLTPSSRLVAQTMQPLLFEHGIVENIEYQIICKSGDILDILVSAVVDRSAPQEMVSLSVVTDITPQKKAERALIESEARYRSIVEGQTELVALASPDLILTFVNAAYARLFGLEQREMLGRSMFDFVPEHVRDQVRAHMQRTMEVLDTLEDENEIKTADGSLRWVSWSDRAIRDAHGRVTAVHSVGRDIDERKRAELRLAESEARYRLLADHSTDMVFQFDANLVRKYVSPACREILGFSPEDLTGATALQSVHPDEAEEVRAAFRDIAAGRLERGSFTHRIRHLDGRWIWVEAAVRATRDPATGAPTGLIGALRDITAKKEVEAKLEEANRRLEILAAQDGLTQINNRRSFDEFFEREIKIARREGTTLSLLMIDVDAFKAYNDCYGHMAGDAALRQVSSAITAGLKRPGDLCARYGGEEFVALLPNTDATGAALVAETIRRNVELLGLDHHMSPWKTLTVSIGIAAANNLGRESLRQDTLLKRADRALYAAKNSGRNTITSWRETEPVRI